MIMFEQKENEKPICPHCQKELNTLWFRELKSDLGKRTLYFCSRCKAVLGVSHRKGLTFGL